MFAILQKCHLSDADLENLKLEIFKNFWENRHLDPLLLKTIVYPVASLNSALTYVILDFKAIFLIHTFGKRSQKLNQDVAKIFKRKSFYFISDCYLFHQNRKRKVGYLCILSSSFLLIFNGNFINNIFLSFSLSNFF